MEKENTSFDVLSATSPTDAAPLHFSRSNPFLSPISRTDYLNSDTSPYSPMFQRYTASDAACFDGGDAEHCFHDPSRILEYQQLYNRYTLCLSKLRYSVEEVDTLRRENVSLRVSNADFSRRISLLLSRDRFLSEFDHLSVSSPPIAAPVPAPVPLSVYGATPQPLAEYNRFERRNPERVSLPKSISVRSKGYLKMMNRSGRETNLHKTVSHQLSPPSQRVYVAGAKDEEDALEFDVYNQGMMKTELCNKWEESGSCPYGENCQFAHGMKELRPVIRHPRYKTEVCRMVLAGDACPYGHRCHFRHSLTQEERRMAAAALLRPPPPR